jgi:hypothetical protein
LVNFIKRVGGKKGLGVGGEKGWWFVVKKNGGKKIGAD